MEEKIKKFLEKETQKTIVDNKANLLELGILDSFTMIRLLNFLEQDLKISVKMEELSPQNFSSINNMIKTIESWK
ncbi:MAG: acyl carrier protein [Candidatus Harrisonbacteria bacterium]|nr:acyl carrier protein [Candidatus Harrisonbacteria bacterium]